MTHTVPEMAEHIAGSIAASPGYGVCLPALVYAQQTLARAGYHDAARDCASFVVLVERAKEKIGT